MNTTRTSINPVVSAISASFFTGIFSAGALFAQQPGAPPTPQVEPGGSSAASKPDGLPAEPKAPAASPSFVLPPSPSPTDPTIPGNTPSSAMPKKRAPTSDITAPLPPPQSLPPPQPPSQPPLKASYPRVSKSTSVASPGKTGSSLKALFGRGVAGATLDLDIDANPQMASQQYQDFVAAFDAQREGAAHAIFGLGESYRKLGRLDEARAQYGRILREFVDFPELAQQSQKLLSQNPPSKWKIATPEAGPSATNRQALAEERELLMEELSLLENELTTVKARISQGLEPTTSAVPVQREILQLKQRLVRLRADEKADTTVRGR